MKIFFVCTTAFVIALSYFSPAPAQKKSSSQDRTDWIASVLKDTGKIKPGMLRKDLFKIFGEEGGLSTREHQTYVYRDCPYIKVDVEFEPVGGSLTPNPGQPITLIEDPDDRIKTISKPYLDWSIMD